MFVQSVMAWVVLAAGALLMLAGLAGGSIFTQPLWTGSGALKRRFSPPPMLAWRYWPLDFGRAPALAILAAGCSMLAEGSLAVIGALWLLAGSFATGAWILQTRLKFIAKYPQVVVLLGLARLVGLCRIHSALARPPCVALSADLPPAHAPGIPAQTGARSLAGLVRVEP